MRKIMLIVTVLIIGFTFSCKKDKEKSTSTTTNANISQIEGRWKLTKLELVTRSLYNISNECTTVVNNINHPKMYIEFTNIPAQSGDCGSYYLVYNCVLSLTSSEQPMNYWSYFTENGYDCLGPIYCSNCACQELNFNDTLFVLYSYPNSYYNVYNNTIYLCFGGAFTIEQLTASNLTVKNNVSRYYFTKM